MNEERVDPAADAVAGDVRRALAREDAVRHALAPVLRHLLGHDDRALFSDEVIARLRGMLRDLARQLCQHAAAARDDGEACGDDPGVAGSSARMGEDLAHLVRMGDDLAHLARMGDELVNVPGLLDHLHAIVLEGQAAQALQERLGIDPVVSPLLQALIGSPEAETAATAMKLLAAQARFARYRQQMRMPLGELPGDLLPGVLDLLPGDAGAAQAAIRQSYDESVTRLGLIARLVTGMGGGAVAALALGHGGVAIFATALGLATGQPRETCLLALQDGQAIRLAVMLRATGVKLATAQASLLAAHPSALASGEATSGELAETMARLSPERAAALLAAVDSHGDWAGHGG